MLMITVIDSEWSNTKHLFEAMCVKALKGEYFHTTAFPMTVRAEIRKSVRKLHLPGNCNTVQPLADFPIGQKEPSVVMRIPGLPVGTNCAGWERP